MDRIFTITEHRLIRSLLACKTDKQIAELIDCSREEISEYVSKLTGVIRRPVVKVPKPVTLKGLAKKSEVARKQKEQKQAKKIARQLQEHHKANKKREERRTFKTIPFNPAGKIQVRLNSRTLVWVLPGTDIDALKKKLRIS